MRRAAKVDLNQGGIVEALRAAGASVQTLAAVGRGVPDLLVGHRGHNLLLEVKGAKGKLTEDQIDWHAGWEGAVHVVRTPEEAVELLRFV